MALAAGMLGGCMMDPPGPSPIYSRLPANQSGVPTGTQPLTAEQRAQYNAIDRQVMTEQNQAIAEDNAARAWANYYSPPPVVYGSYYGGGWGSGWGVGYGTGWGW